MSDPLSELEDMLARSDQGRYVLRLYITGSTPQSSRAVENVKRLCEERLKDRYELKVIDLYCCPDQAGEEQILCAPTLVKQFPLPLKRLIGDLSNTKRLLMALDLKDETA